MKIIVKYQTEDGCEFSSAEKAAEHENLSHMVNDIMRQLPPVPSRGRTQVDPAKMREAKRLIIELCRMQFPDEDVFKYAPEDIHPRGYAGRFLDDTGGPINRAWYWFACYNNGWVYEQPFYAINPEKYHD